MSRQVIQIAAAAAVDEDHYDRLLALCDDNTMWVLMVDADKPLSEEWQQLPSIPGT